MNIVNVGYRYRHPSKFCIDRPHGSGDWILLIIKTEAFAVFHGNRVHVPQNSAIIFQKGTPQLYGATLEEYVNDWIHFEPEDSEVQEFLSLGIPFDTVIPLRETGELSYFIERMFWERYSQNLHKEATMRRYFDLILLKLSEQIRQQSSENEHPYYAAFCGLRNEIRLEPQADWSIDRISQRMNLSRSYVQHLYKLFFGLGIVADVRDSRMEHAKYLLSSGNQTVTAIAHSCGYETDVHFMRMFKKATGVTPSAFREQYRVSRRELRESKSRNPFSI